MIVSHFPDKYRPLADRLQEASELVNIAGKTLNAEIKIKAIEAMNKTFTL